MERPVGFEPTPKAWKAYMLAINTMGAEVEESRGVDPPRVTVHVRFQGGVPGRWRALHNILNFFDFV